jgi:hypothetical protein
VVFCRGAVLVCELPAIENTSRDTGTKRRKFEKHFWRDMEPPNPKKVNLRPQKSPSAMHCKPETTLG